MEDGDFISVQPGAKPRITLVGHLAGPVLYGAERSLLDIAAAVDRTRFDLACILPADNPGYTAALRKYTNDITIFPYRWDAAYGKSDETVERRFEEAFRRTGTQIVHV